MEHINREIRNAFIKAIACMNYCYAQKEDALEDERELYNIWDSTENNADFSGDMSADLYDAVNAHIDWKAQALMYWEVANQLYTAYVMLYGYDHELDNMLKWGQTIKPQLQ